MFELNSSVGFPFLVDFPTQFIHLHLQQQIIPIRLHPLIILHHGLNFFLQRDYLIHQMLSLHILLHQFSFIGIQGALQSLIIQLYVFEFPLKVLDMLLEAINYDVLGLHSTDGSFALAETQLTGDVGLHEALGLFFGVDFGGFDDLCAEAVDKFIPGLGHHLSIIFTIINRFDKI